MSPDDEFHQRSRQHSDKLAVRVKAVTEGRKPIAVDMLRNRNELASETAEAAEKVSNSSKCYNCTLEYVS